MTLLEEWYVKNSAIANSSQYSSERERERLGGGGGGAEQPPFEELEIEKFIHVLASWPTLGWGA